MTMSDAVPIRKPSSVFDQIKEMQDHIMHRAYESFERSGMVLDRDLDNWAQAERELVWKPPFELCERDGNFVLTAALAGVEAKDIDIEVTPEDVVLKAENRHEHSKQ